MCPEVQLSILCAGGASLYRLSAGSFDSLGRRAVANHNTAAAAGPLDQSVMSTWFVMSRAVPVLSVARV